MALFKPFRGKRSELNALELHDGYAYFCIDDGSFHIDYEDENGQLQRKQISAKEAESLFGYDIVDEVTSSSTATELPTAHAVYDKYAETIIGLSVDGTTVTYIKGDGSTHSFETQDTNTTYSLATDSVTGLTKLYATTGNAEDGTMTQKAIKTELDRKVGVEINDTTLTFVI